jgi:hypothetical protein
MRMPFAAAATGNGECFCADIGFAVSEDMTLGWLRKFTEQPILVSDALGKLA